MTPDPCSRSPQLLRPPIVACRPTTMFRRCRSSQRTSRIQRSSRSSRGSTRTCLARSGRSSSFSRMISSRSGFRSPVAPPAAHTMPGSSPRPARALPLPRPSQPTQSPHRQPPPHHQPQGAAVASVGLLRPSPALQRSRKSVMAPLILQ